MRENGSTGADTFGVRMLVELWLKCYEIQNSKSLYSALELAQWGINNEAVMFSPNMKPLADKFAKVNLKKSKKTIKAFTEETTMGELEDFLTSLLA